METFRRQSSRLDAHQESIESTHEKIIRKFAVLDEIIEALRRLNIRTEDFMVAKQQAYEEYYTVVTIPLVAYYVENLPSVVTRYWAILDSRNISNKIEAIAAEISSLVNTVQVKHAARVSSRKNKPSVVTHDSALTALLETFQRIELSERRVVINTQCACGGDYEIRSEISKKRCVICGKISDVRGIAFRGDSQPNDSRQKQNNSDTARHYKFWIERLQAIEKKDFTDDILIPLRQEIRKRNYTTSDLTCEKMREILKRTKLVKPVSDNLNEHIPLLVKTFGGRPPPLLTASENEILRTRFIKVMTLYTAVKPASRNKRYYPYFIDQLLAEMFKDNPAKLRLREYIHQQNLETVRRNDETYQMICCLADPADGIVFHHADYRPVGNF